MASKVAVLRKAGLSGDAADMDEKLLLGFLNQHPNATITALQVRNPNIVVVYEEENPPDKPKFAAAMGKMA